MIEKIKRKANRFLKRTLSVAHQEQITQVEQVAIANQYRLMKKLMTSSEMPAFRDVGFKVYSQFEEDGILFTFFQSSGQPINGLLKFVLAMAVNVWPQI